LKSNKRLIARIIKNGKPVVLVLFTGRPLVLVQETVPAILNTWFAGSEAGSAIADVLFGDENPSGKLTATFPRSRRYLFITVIKYRYHLVIQKENSKNSNLIISMKEMNLYFLWFWIKLHHIRLFKSKVVIRQDDFDGK
jgi:hypothetical protein